jgi:hypothetical protein
MLLLASRRKHIEALAYRRGITDGVDKVKRRRER